MLPFFKILIVITKENYYIEFALFQTYKVHQEFVVSMPIGVQCHHFAGCAELPDCLATGDHVGGLEKVSNPFTIVF
jgi:hypothetical protein